jgi:osmotically-inducible protein OsmY
MNSTMEKTDVQLKTDVLLELEYEPSVKVTDIGVLVHDGTVTLNGYATTYGEKWEARRAAERVAGVKAIADEIEVKLPQSLRRTDGEIATAAINQLDFSTIVPKNAIKVTVSEGWITLEGEVEWWYQKNAAGNLVHHLFGVKGISNMVSIVPKVTATKVETDIKSAFQRSALLDANKIEVKIDGNQVVLRGKVRNYDEREEAARVAWSAPGIFSVDNQIKVKWSVAHA